MGVTATAQLRDAADEFAQKVALLRAAVDRIGHLPTAAEAGRRDPAWRFLSAVRQAQAAGHLPADRAALLDASVPGWRSAGNPRRRAA